MKIFKWGLGPLVAVLIAGCGDLSMPDTGSGRHKSGSEGNPVTPSTEASFDLAKCGLDLTKPTTNVASRRMSMVPQKIVIPKLLWTETYSITGLSIIEESLVRSIASFSAQSTPSSSLDQVNAAVNALSGGYTADLLSVTDRAKIGMLYPDWKGVFCSLQPAIKIENGLTDKVVIEFDKPLPVSPLLIADFSRLRSEFGVKRSWSAITAKVTDSMNPDVPVGSTWSGRVSLIPVSPTVTIDGPSGKQQIQAQFAAKITYDFGSASANAAMGLPSSVTWYVDAETNMFKLTQVDFGDGTIVNYLPDR
jgi:hypothetical protein